MSKNKIWGFLTYSAVALCIAFVAAIFLSYKKNKQSYLNSNSFLEFLEAIDYRFNDIKYKIRTSQPSKAPVVLLAIDDMSVQEIGRWPWSRDLLAHILEQLIDLGSSTVGLDVIFSEPEKANPENDNKLAQVVSKNSSKIILGTFSNNELSIFPYQDYCITEAFLLAGGDQLVKLNASLVIDDPADSFEDVPWDQLFRPLFAAVIRSVKKEYLREHSKIKESQLSGFQRNHLKALTQSALFGYCSRWLTPKDELFAGNKEKLLKVYSDIFYEKLPHLGPDIAAKLQIFKSTVKEHPTPQYGEWVSNILNVQTPAEYTASFVTHLDVDGTIRRYPLFYRSGNRLGTSYIPSIALQMYLVATGYRAEAVLTENAKLKQVEEFKIIDNHQSGEGIVQRLPVDTQGRLLVNYYGQQSTLPYVSAKDLLNDDEFVTVYQRDRKSTRSRVVLSKNKVSKKEFFKNKAVLVGATSMGIYDLRNTPLESNYPGPEIHLSVLANLMEQNYLKSIVQEDVALPVFLIIFGILLSFWLSQLEAVKSMLSFGVFIFLASVVDFYFFDFYKIVFSSIFVLILIIAVHFVAIVFKYLSEEKKKQALKRTFAKYVSPAVVDEILKADDNLKLGGKKQEMTVFFSDVRGFTKFSEKMDPVELAQFLNEYLTPMTEVIFKNKGTLDKYMGDGLMAFFGAPIAHKDHAHSACKAALESLEKLKILQDQFKKKNWPEIDIGIGINTGTMSVGNMGSEIVQSYTVIGDAVNLGARLEGSTKHYGTRILVSEATFSATKNDFLFREVDRVRVVGKKEPIGAFELICELKTSQEHTQNVSYVEKYQEAYALYTNRNFLMALKHFETLESERPSDLLVQIYKKRCSDFITEPPPLGWDGVYEMKSK